MRSRATPIIRRAVAAKFADLRGKGNRRYQAYWMARKRFEIALAAEIARARDPQAYDRFTMSVDTRGD